MNDIMEVLDQKNMELGNALFSLRQTITVYKLVGLNADKAYKVQGDIGEK